MGGKAFPLLQTIRLNKSQYESVASSCLAKLTTAFPDGEFRIIESYREKETFGDLDILWCGSAGTAIEIRDTLEAIDHQPNGPVTSFAVPVSSDSIFQVDLIKVHCNQMESAFAYFAYNDLGNLLGRIFHRMGLKLGHMGLAFVVREDGNDSHAIREIILTRSWKEALEFVGYDYERWCKGFDSLEDVFRFAIDNPLANRTIFRLDETNHQARVRDRKRLTYQKFLRWVNDPANGVPENESIPKIELRKTFLAKAFETFPGFRKEFDQIQKEMVDRREAKRKFNGEIVRELTGLNGKDLGYFMKTFIEAITKEKQMTAIEWALTSNQEEIESQIRLWVSQIASSLRYHV